MKEIEDNHRGFHFLNIFLYKLRQMSSDCSIIHSWCSLPERAVYRSILLTAVSNPEMPTSFHFFCLQNAAQIYLRVCCLVSVLCATDAAPSHVHDSCDSPRVRMCVLIISSSSVDVLQLVGNDDRLRSGGRTISIKSVNRISVRRRCFEKEGEIKPGEHITHLETLQRRRVPFHAGRDSPHCAIRSILHLLRLMCRVHSLFLPPYTHAYMLYVKYFPTFLGLVREKLASTKRATKIEEEGWLRKKKQDELVVPSLDHYPRYTSPLQSAHTADDSKARRELSPDCWSDGGRKAKTSGKKNARKRYFLRVMPSACRGRFCLLCNQMNELYTIQ